MAQWLPIVQVDITLNTTGSTREGFGLPLFIASTDAFPERVKTFASLEDMMATVPAFSDETSAVYKAAVKLWAQTPKVTQFSVARRDMQYLLSIGDAPQAGQSFSVQLTGSADGGVTVQNSTVSVNASSGQDAGDIFTALQTAIQNDATFGSLVSATLSGTDDLSRLLIKTVDADNVFIKASVAGSSPITAQASPVDSPADFIPRIREYDDTWYFVGLEERNSQTIIELSTLIGAMRKMFFTATSLQSATQGTVLTNASDWVAKLAQDGHPRTVVLWHHTAESDYPEFAYIGYGAPYDAGSISWSNAQLSGVGYSQQINGRPLNAGQKAALETRNCNYVDYDGGVSVVRHGKVSKGEWIDIVRGADWMQYDLTVSLRDLLVNQKGGKITYDDRGITRVRQVIESSLERAVARNFLESYTVNVPRAKDISIELKRNRILKDVSFSGILAGAIDDVDLKGTVAYE